MISLTYQHIFHHIILKKFSYYFSNQKSSPVGSASKVGIIDLTLKGRTLKFLSFSWRRSLPLLLSIHHRRPASYTRICLLTAGCVNYKYCTVIRRHTFWVAVTKPLVSPRILFFRATFIRNIWNWEKLTKMSPDGHVQSASFWDLQKHR